MGIIKFILVFIAGIIVGVVFMFVKDSSSNRKFGHLNLSKELHRQEIDEPTVEIKNYKENWGLIDAKPKLPYPPK